MTNWKFITLESTFIYNKGNFSLEQLKPKSQTLKELLSYLPGSVWKVNKNNFLWRQPWNMLQIIFSKGPRRCFLDNKMISLCLPISSSVSAAITDNESTFKIGLETLFWN